jgi:glutamyl-Q tRNA(Asp) synthetase
MITRFAPSPTGYLHWGHARAAREAFDAARRSEGVCYLRIEDIDHTRCRSHFTSAIYEDLSWLGFEWPQPVRLQSEHITDYHAVLTALKSRGLIYPCWKTRAEIKAEMAARNMSVYTGGPNSSLKPLGGIPLSSGAGPAAWRLSIAACRAELGAEFDRLTYNEQNLDGIISPQPAQSDRFGDVILGRKDIGVSYHLAVVHDDAAQAVTHIVRGEDLKDQTGIHVLLQRLMGWPTPIYRHHKVIKRADGQKLAKRDGDPSLRAARESGITPAQIWAAVLETSY